MRVPEPYIVSGQKGLATGGFVFACGGCVTTIPMSVDEQKLLPMISTLLLPKGRLPTNLLGAMYHCLHKSCVCRPSPLRSPKQTSIWQDGKQPIGADPGANHCVENLRRCSLHRRGRSAARGRTVRACAGAEEFVGGA
jgi:hypothetical protein